jgi:hypothetical protein
LAAFPKTIVLEKLKIGFARQPHRLPDKPCKIPHTLPLLTVAVLKPEFQIALLLIYKKPALICTAT